MTAPVIIAGAGPVGLTFALLLHRQGQDVLLFETAEELKPLGVGINLLPHSVRVLYGLDLADRLDATGIRTSALHYYNKLGQHIWAEPRGLAAGYRFPQYSIHRGELQWLLLEETIARLGADRVRTGHTLTSWEDREGGIEVTFARPDGSTVTESGCCLVAADGIRSTARRRLFPEEGDPIYGGRILWRGTTVAPRYLDGQTMFMAGHQDRKFVAYPIAHPPDSAAGQTALINWIAELPVPQTPAQLQDWGRRVAVDAFRASFASWNFGWVDIPAIIDGAEAVYEYPLTDRDPLPRWRHGNTTLIGDAAHPMYPIGSNGASQGILDAECLAGHLRTAKDLPAAFDAYEAERRPATAAIVLANRQNGPEQVMQMVEERAPDGFERIEDVITREELEAVANRYKQTAGFDRDTVNAKR